MRDRHIGDIHKNRAFTTRQTVQVVKELERDKVQWLTVLLRNNRVFVFRPFPFFARLAPKLLRIHAFIETKFTNLIDRYFRIFIVFLLFRNAFHKADLR